MLYSNMLLCSSISDSDAPYMMAKISTNKYQHRYKFVRDVKNFNLQKCIDDFKQLPFSVMYSLITQMICLTP